MIMNCQYISKSSFGKMCFFVKKFLSTNSVIMFPRSAALHKPLELLLTFKKKTLQIEAHNDKVLH